MSSRVALHSYNLLLPQFNYSPFGEGSAKLKIHIPLPSEKSRAFAFNPNLAVGENFFLPNRNGAFQFANGPLAGFKGSTSVRSADGDNDAGFADLQAAGAMNDADVGDVESLVSLCSQSFHLTQSHQLVSFVNEMER